MSEALGEGRASKARARRWPGIGMRLVIAAAALWFGMSLPVYFRSISPLVLEEAARGTPGLAELARTHLESGRPGLAEPFLALLPEAGKLQERRAALYEDQPLYRWSGGPAPFYEQFLAAAPFLREDETAVLPTLLPRQHREELSRFLAQSANRNVQRILASRELTGWQRFYPVQSSSGQPLEATILATALLEQGDGLPEPVRSSFLANLERALDGDTAAFAEVESFYLSLLTLGRRANWLAMKSTLGNLGGREELLFAARALQVEPSRWPVLFAALQTAPEAADLAAYLREHRERGWAGLRTALGMGGGAVATLVRNGDPLYQPPALWRALPESWTRQQERFKAFAEQFPNAAMGVRALAFGLCGVCLAGILRLCIAGAPPPRFGTRRFLLSLDSAIAGVLVMLLLWVLIEPGLLDFRPNEQGSLQLNLAAVVPESAAPAATESETTMIDQVTILVLLLFLVLQLLVFVFGLLKIAEVRKRPVRPRVKMHLLDNEENLFDLGLYVGLGGTVASLILVVLNVVDASLMAAYASTLFGIIFVAILKVGFLRPFRRKLILEEDRTETAR
ncbi:MAG: hypothetical protein GVY10_02715 [Verrucomicrobia bacterium]|jgi:hypothetical protein|nr:hypothetical protein [Verrucomicrobiota bacterium]